MTYDSPVPDGSAALTTEALDSHARKAPAILTPLPVVDAESSEHLAVAG